MKRPAIQLYFGDWLRNAKLRRCSWGARGVLVDVMALMHDSEEYGVLRWPLVEIARAVGCPVSLTKELAEKAVLKGGDKRVDAYRWAPSHAGTRGAEVVLVAEQEGPLWYSARMVRDEYKRTNRGVGTRFGTPAKLPTTTPKSSPSGTPSRGNGDANGAPYPSPSRREGDGASTAFSSSTMQFAESTQQRARDDGSERSTAGHKNGLKFKGKGSSAWRRDAGAALEQARLRGFDALRGESTEELVRRIDEFDERHGRQSA